MFKGKIWTWIIVLAICSLFYWFFNIVVPSFGTDGNIVINSEIKENDTFLNDLKGVKFNKYKSVISTDNPEIVFSLEEQKLGYVKYDNFISSPMVLYFPYDIDNHTDGFSIVGKSTSYYVPFKCDLNGILIAIEQGKTWEEVGYSKKVLKGKVQLIIPDESSILYKPTKDLFLRNLYEVESLNEEELKKAENRVKEIMNKCVKVFDVSASLHEAYEKDTFIQKDQTAVIVAPEYLYTQIGEATSTSYTDSYIPVYPMKSYFISANVFCIETEDTEKIEKYEKVLKNFKDKSKLYDNTGWRVTDRTYSLSYIIWNDYK